PLLALRACDHSIPSCGAGNSTTSEEQFPTQLSPNRGRHSVSGTLVRRAVSPKRRIAAAALAGQPDRGGVLLPSSTRHGSPSRQQIVGAPRHDEPLPPLAKTGQTPEAHRALSQIYGWFTEGFGTPDLVDAKALLEELGP